MSRYTSVIFDFDGTLFDTQRAIAARRSQTAVPSYSMPRVNTLYGMG